MGSSGSKQEVSRYRGLGAWHGMTWHDMAWHGKGLELPMNYSIELNYLSSISLYLALILTFLCPFVPCLQVLKRCLWGGSMILNLAPFNHDSKYARSEEMIPVSASEETTFFLLKTHIYIYILYHNSNINIHNILLDAFWACYCLQLTSVSKVLDVKPLPMLCEAPPVKKPTMKMCCACPETKVLRLLQKTPEWDMTFQYISNAYCLKMGNCPKLQWS